MGWDSQHSWWGGGKGRVGDRATVLEGGGHGSREAQEEDVRVRRRMEMYQTRGVWRGEEVDKGEEEEGEEGRTVINAGGAMAGKNSRNERQFNTSPR